MAMEDSLMRPRPKSTLLPGPGSKAAAKPPEPEVVVNNVAEPGPWDDFDPLPQPGDPYKAYARPSNKPEILLHVMLKDGFFRGFAWSNLDSVDTVSSESPGVGPVLVLRFAGLMPTELRLCGSNLGKLHALVGQNRIVWIREHPSRRGFDGAGARDDKAEVITGVIIVPWKRKREAGGDE